MKLVEHGIATSRAMWLRTLSADAVDPLKIAAC